MKSWTQKYFTKFDKLNQDLLTYKPWLWQTRIHVVAFVMAAFNLLVCASLFLHFYRDLTFAFIIGTISIIGFFFWLYEVSQITIEEGFGALDGNKLFQRYFAFLLGTALFAFPNIMIWIARHPRQELFTIEALHHNFPGIVAITVIALIALIIQIWQVIGLRKLGLTLAINLMILVGIYFTTQINPLISLLCVLLIAQLLVGDQQTLFRRNLYFDADQDKQDKSRLPTSFIMLGYTSIQLVMPLLFGLGSISVIILFEVNHAVNFLLLGCLPVSFIAYLYLYNLWPHYLRTMASIKALPEKE